MAISNEVLPANSNPKNNFALFPIHVHKKCSFMDIMLTYHEYRKFKCRADNQITLNEAIAVLATVFLHTIKSMPFTKTCKVHLHFDKCNFLYSFINELIG